jgi:hypothetical protein
MSSLWSSALPSLPNVTLPTTASLQATMSSTLSKVKTSIHNALLPNSFASQLIGCKDLVSINEVLDRWEGYDMAKLLSSDLLESSVDLIGKEHDKPTKTSAFLENEQVKSRLLSLMKKCAWPSASKFIDSYIEKPDSTTAETLKQTKIVVAAEEKPTEVPQIVTSDNLLISLEWLAAAKARKTSTEAHLNHIEKIHSTLESYQLRDMEISKSVQENLVLHSSRKADLEKAMKQAESETAVLAKQRDAVDAEINQLEEVKRKLKIELEKVSVEITNKHNMQKELLVKDEKISLNLDQVKKETSEDFSKLESAKSQLETEQSIKRSLFEGLREEIETEKNKFKSINEDSVSAYNAIEQQIRKIAMSKGSNYITESSNVRTHMARKSKEYKEFVSELRSFLDLYSAYLEDPSDNLAKKLKIILEEMTTNN